MTDSGSRWQKWVICAVLGAAVLAAFWPARQCGFVSFDDLDYVTSNPPVQEGLHWKGIKWALTTTQAGNWHPLTWVSHMIDCQLYGLQPAGHHLSSVLLHMANSILLFLVLNRLTGALWPSAFVAALFGLHPLRVESVVWVSERKDVLSTFFWILTVGAYVRYIEALKVQGTRSKIFYALSVAFFALGLMAKPMLVTLPFVLLLLDYWPFGRLEFGAKFSWRHVAEKIPFFALAAGSSLTTFVIQNHLGVVATLSRFPLGVRLANIPVAYARYMEKFFWPAGLSVFYPHRPLGWMEVAGAMALLGAISIVAVLRWRAQPYLIVGWCWFLGALVPAIGLVQVGYQAMADRYSYIPTAGLGLMVAWAVRDWAGDHAIRRGLAALGGGCAVIACVTVTEGQIPYWHDSRSLFRRAVEVTDGNYVAYYNLGCNARDQGDFPQAILYFQQALSTQRDDTLWVNHARAYNDLGYAYLHEGQITNAVTNFEQALLIEPRYPEAYYNLGRAFLANGQPDVAVDCFQRALAMDNSVAEIHCQLANALAQWGRPNAALAEYSRALQLNPALDEAANNLALLLATCPDRSLRDGPRAIALARQASDRSHGQNPAFLGTLAAAYAEAGRFSDAVATAQAARQLALARKNPALAALLKDQLRRYQAGLGGRPR